MTPGVRQMLALAGTAAALALAGCSTSPTGQSAPAASTDEWSGRIAVTVESEPPQQFSAAFDLAGNERAGRLSLASPLGSTLALLEWRPGQALLRQGDQARDYASLDALTASVTGVALPLEALFSWLHGQAAPAAGWRVDLDAWGQGRIAAQRLEPLPRAELRVIIDRD